MSKHFKTAITVLLRRHRRMVVERTPQKKHANSQCDNPLVASFFFFSSVAIVVQTVFRRRIPLSVSRRENNSWISEDNAYPYDSTHMSTSLSGGQMESSDPRQLC